MSDEKIQEIIDEKFEAMKKRINAAIENLYELKYSVENMDYLRQLAKSKEAKQP